MNNKPIPCHFSASQIFALAEAIAKKLKLTPDTDLASIVEKLNGKIKYVHPSKITNATATISVQAGSPPDFEILLSSLAFPLRERFSIAHELGHLFLHSRYGGCSVEATHIEAESNDIAEREANFFASGFLIPQSELEKLRERPILELAAHFYVPIPVVEARLRIL